MNTNDIVTNKLVIDLINIVNKGDLKMDKQKVKDMICKAIDNIPECANITDCYIEHGFASSKAYIKVVIETIDKTKDSLIEFHRIAHNSFDTNMDNIS